MIGNVINPSDPQWEYPWSYLFCTVLRFKTLWIFFLQTQPWKHSICFYGHACVLDTELLWWLKFLNEISQQGVWWSNKSIQSGPHWRHVVITTCVCIHAMCQQLSVVWINDMIHEHLEFKLFFFCMWHVWSHHLNSGYDQLSSEPHLLQQIWGCELQYQKCALHQQITR